MYTYIHIYIIYIYILCINIQLDSALSSSGVDRGEIKDLAQWVRKLLAVREGNFWDDTGKSKFPVKQNSYTCAEQKQGFPDFKQRFHNIDFSKCFGSPQQW